LWEVVVAKFRSHGVFCFVQLREVAEMLDHLLRAEGDQNAEYNNTNFADELTPAMQRFRNVEMRHCGSPPTTRSLTHGLRSAMGGRRRGIEHHPSFFEMAALTLISVRDGACAPA